MRKRVFMINELFFPTRQGLNFYFGPFIAEKQSDARAELLGSLELFADLGRREGVIDAIATIAENLDLSDGIRAPFFFRDDDVDIEILLSRDGVLQLLFGRRDFTD